MADRSYYKGLERRLISLTSGFTSFLVNRACFESLKNETNLNKSCILTHYHDRENQALPITL
jgi:hypothetical protein